MLPSSLPTPRLRDPDSVPVLRWGIVGPGWIAERFVKSLRENTRQQIVAVASRSRERAADFARTWSIPGAFGDVQEMLALDRLDAVYVATPHNHHYPDALKVIEAGKHVLIEKPLALNAREAADLGERARARNLLCMEAMWCDFLPKYDVLSQLLADGALGDVHSLIADHGEHFTTDHRIFNPDLAGGPMLDLGSYLVGLSVKVAGKPKKVIAIGQPAPGGRVNGQTSMLFEHGNGMHAVLNTTLFSNTPCAATIAGRDATLVLPGPFYNPGPFTLTASDGSRTLTFEDPKNRYDQLYHEAIHFAWCVGEGLRESPIRPLQATLDTLSTMDEVRRQIGVRFNEERD
ncbi:Gfo/Idh/MocA family protein [Azotobacter vinelandii]|uniref:Gfo/Idh/MocA family protein n=1 Tax=Azotobacter vinelandii TaxID=354 RepID=UPI0007746BA6|nr:Gfo/Idh/MocA family oxidoreductase [Azotobacter vinelandii]